MKKLVLFSLAVLMVPCISNASVGTYQDIKLRTDISRKNAAWLAVSGGYKINCDDADRAEKENAGNGIVVLEVKKNGNITKQPKQCYTRESDGDNHNDEWRAIGDLPTCTSTCPDGKLIPYYVDSKYALCNLGGVGHRELKSDTDTNVHIFDYQKNKKYALTTTSSILCKTCISGYKRDASGNCVSASPSTPTSPSDRCQDFGNSNYVNVGNYSSNNLCPNVLGDDGAAVCLCQCVKDSAGKVYWKCNVNKCKGDSEKVYHYDENATNSTGGLGTCTKKGGGGGGSGSCMNRKTAAGRACCRAGNLTKWTESTQNCECVGAAAGKKWVYTEGAETGQCLAAGEQTCEQKFAGNAEAIACCLAGGNWANAKCECPGGKDWSYKNGIGECLDTSTATTDCIYRFSGKVKCANGNSMEITEQKQLTKAELGGLTCDQFNSMYQADVTKLNQFFANQCQQGAFVTIVTGPSAAEIESAKSVLSAFFTAAQSNASVWKNAEGKFNTARLASDLTAGVVLGSVGGVVSGVVIKKKQVQKGFEALHCAVGGQTIADWGDEFNVGLRR